MGLAGSGQRPSFGGVIAPHPGTGMDRSTSTAAGPMAGPPATLHTEHSMGWHEASGSGGTRG